MSVACFEGGNATGLPCKTDAQCGAGIQCIDEICGGAEPTTSETMSSMSVTVGDSSTMNPTTPTTSASSESSGGTDESGSSGTTGPATVCPEYVQPGACGAGAMRAGTTVSATEVPIADLGRVFSIVTGPFWGDDERMDLGVLTIAPSFALHIIESDPRDLWNLRASQVDFLGDVEPYDLEVGRFACNEDQVFSLVGLSNRIAVIGWSEANSFAYNEVMGDGTVSIPSTSFSAVVGDFVEDPEGQIDIAFAGNGHVSVIENFNGSYSPYDLFSAEGDLPDRYYEPWNSAVLRGPDKTRLLVGQGGYSSAVNTESVFSFRIAGDPGARELIAAPVVAGRQFDNPFGVAVGDFDGDNLEDVAVGERRLDDPTIDGEGTTLAGFVHFFSMADGDADQLEAFDAFPDGVSVGVGLRTLGVADLNCDDNDDLIIGYTGSSDSEDGAVPEILFGGDLGTRVPAGDTLVHSAAQIGVGDVDGDGRPEAIVGDYGNGAAPGDRFVVIRVD